MRAESSLLTGMNGLLLPVSTVFGAFLVAAPAYGQTTVVFEVGTEGYHTFRIPAVVEAKDGALLAFCEGRKANAKDHGDIDLVMKRSSDQGKTWSPLKLLQDDGGDAPITMGNPVPVVDSSNGRVHLIFCRNNSEVFHTWSDDSGETWSQRVKISDGLTGEGWGWYATGPGHGIQLQSGAQKGRLVIPANHRIGEKGSDKGSYGSHVIYSDDGGKSWTMGGIAGEANGIHPNETTAVELKPGTASGSRVYFNTRNNGGTDPHGRAAIHSDDGGKTFLSSCVAIPDLETPAVQGSSLRWSESRVFFSSPRGKKRENLTLWESKDEGATWQSFQLVQEGPAAYADLVRTRDGKLGVLHENGSKHRYERISFTRVDVP